MPWRMLLVQLAGFVVALVWFSSVAAGSDLAPAGVCPGQDAVGAAPAGEAATMRCLVDWVRRRHGLAPLRDSSLLDASARMRAAAIRRCGQFSHTPCGQAFAAPFAAVGYTRPNVAYGENLGWGTGGLGTPRHTFLAWLASPEHRANIFRPGWRDVGVAVAGPAPLFGFGGVSLWVLQLGARG